MELVEMYRQSAYNGHFDFVNLSCNLHTGREHLRSFLARFQKGSPWKNCLTMANIESVVSQPRLKDYVVDLTSKLVIEKANFDVSEGTKANGITTKLLFLMRNPHLPSEWLVYGYAKGRYRDLDILNICDGEPLGYSYYYSLQEKQCGLSGGISNSICIRSLIEKLQKRSEQRYQPIR